jgi:hypothetical protein
MPPEKSRTAELEQEVVHLMEEVERYRTAAEDALQQLDWCIGYFAGAHKPQIARALSANRAHIRREIMRRSAQTVSAASGDGRS